ncbi:hypothetical protein O181_021361 [Austropuccinia psidii MF-1]|uniref:Uncharacterized protein n=1 Tax=Austropuccinia psidii MF-1 TaxID=1389203 RepID=A0A9Q3GVP8_9BASI|nr:hypothetical protein [Austropuccinia psidii MF-1]
MQHSSFPNLARYKLHKASNKASRTQYRPSASLTDLPKDPFWKEQHHPGRKEGRGQRRSGSFSGVVGRFPGTSRTIFRGPGEDGEEEENSGEDEGSDGTEGVPAPVGASQFTEGPTLAQANQPVSHQSELSLLAIMQQMTQIMANHQAASSSEASRPPDLNTPSMKAPECFVGLNPSMLEASFILVN